jgi:hypothetical protein
MKKLISVLTVLSFIGILTACGGGGGGTTSTDTTSTDTTGTDTTGTDTTSTPTGPKMSVSYINDFPEKVTYSYNVNANAFVATKDIAGVSQQISLTTSIYEFCGWDETANISAISMTIADPVLGHYLAQCKISVSDGGDEYQFVVLDKDFNMLWRRGTQADSLYGPYLVNQSIYWAEKRVSSRASSWTTKEASYAYAASMVDTTDNTTTDGSTDGLLDLSNIEIGPVIMPAEPIIISDITTDTTDTTTYDMTLISDPRGDPISSSAEVVFSVASDGASLWKMSYYAPQKSECNYSYYLGEEVCGRYASITGTKTLLIYDDSLDGGVGGVTVPGDNMTSISDWVNYQLNASQTWEISSMHRVANGNAVVVILHGSSMSYNSQLNRDVYDTYAGITVPQGTAKDFVELRNFTKPSSTTSTSGTINCSTAWSGPDDVWSQQSKLQCDTACLYESAGVQEGVDASCQILSGMGESNLCSVCQ